MESGTVALLRRADAPLFLDQSKLKYLTSNTLAYVMVAGPPGHYPNSDLESRAASSGAGVSLWVTLCFMELRPLVWGEYEHGKRREQVSLIYSLHLKSREKFKLIQTSS